MAAQNVQNVSVISSFFRNCTGDEAGAIAVHANTIFSSNNFRNFRNLTILDCSGGTSNSREGGGAGSISISYDSDSGSNTNNVHSVSNIQIGNSSGGTNTKRGGATGSISISYHSGNDNNNNVHSMSDIHISNSSGGTNTNRGTAVGAASFSYTSTTGSNNNSHFLSNTSFVQCYGGDRTQGAGALVVHSLGRTSGMQTIIGDSVFTANQGAISQSAKSPSSGAAGAVLIYAQDLGATSRARIVRTDFVSNILDSACTGGLCYAGALATSVHTDIQDCRFHNNTCPRNSGGIYSDAAVALKDSVFTDNTASQVFFGTANVGQISASNTSLDFNVGLYCYSVGLDCARL